LTKELYNKFIDSLELIEEFIPEFTWKRHISAIDPKKKINLDIKFKSVKPKINSDFFICGDTLEIKGIDDEENIQFRIKGTILLRIISKSEINQECVKFYSENTVQLSTIPVFRSLVRESLIKMGLPPFTLPFLKRRAQSTEKKFN
jgi:hypothetical protein